MTPEEWNNWLIDRRNLNPAGPGADSSQVRRLEQVAGAELPLDYANLLLGIGGLRGEHGEDIIWSAAQAVEENTTFRTEAAYRDLYMPFDSLLMIGENGGGDHFAFPITASGRVEDLHVLRWNHENDSRSWEAGGLMAYLRKWSDGEIA